MDPLLLCMLRVCHAFLSVHAALWPPAGKGLTSWLSCVIYFVVVVVFLCFCHFPMWYPGSGVVLDCVDS